VKVNGLKIVAVFLKTLRAAGREFTVLRIERQLGRKTLQRSDLGRSYSAGVVQTSSRIVAWRGAQHFAATSFMFAHHQTGETVSPKW
jgi:hypothetical protein